MEIVNKIISLILTLFSLIGSFFNPIEVYHEIESGFESGSITGLKARTRATVDEISRNLTEGTAKVTITSDISQTITVSCGISDKTETVTLKSRRNCNC